MGQPSTAFTLGREPAWYASDPTTTGHETTLSARFLERCIKSGMYVTLGDGKSRATQASLQSYLRTVPNNEGFGYIDGMGKFLVVTGS